MILRGSCARQLCSYNKIAKVKDVQWSQARCKILPTLTSNACNIYKESFEMTSQQRIPTKKKVEPSIDTNKLDQTVPHPTNSLIVMSAFQTATSI